MKKRLILLSALMSISIIGQARPKTGGDDAYIIDTRPPVSNNVVIEWADSKARGGDAYMKPIEWTSKVEVRHEAPSRIRGDNKLD